MTIQGPDEDIVKAQVLNEMEDAKNLAKSFNFEEVKSGQWFFRVFQQVVRAYDRNARTAYFQKKYPGLPADEIADILSSVTVRYATIAGSVAGVAATANLIAAVGSAGMTASLFLSSVGAEMLYLSYIQMRLVLDMSVVYDLQLDPEDPEDILLVFGYALGVAPTEIIGKGLVIATGAGTKSVVKSVVSKGTLEAVQKFGQRIGFKILQRTIIKYAVPVASAAVGGGYNYIATRSVGQIAKAHFKNRGKVTDELRAILSKQKVYDLAVPAAVMFMAQVDGDASPKEMELYRAMLSRMSFEEYTTEDFKKLSGDEQNVLEAISQIGDVELRKALVELLTMMAICDGELTNKEREFLGKAAEQLDVALDIDAVEDRVKEYRVVDEKNVVEKAAGAVGSALVSAIDHAGQTAGKLMNLFGKVWKREEGETVAPALHTQDEPLERLQRIKQMFEAGLITEAEFDAKKAEILSSI